MAITLITLAQMTTSLSLYAQSTDKQLPLEQSNASDAYTLNMKNVDILTLIDTVAQRLNKIFIVDPRVQATVTIISSEPTDADSLYELFLSVLAVHGFTAVEAGNLTKIVPTNAAVQSAVPLLNEQSPTTDELVTKVIQVNTVPAQQLVETLRPLLSPGASINAEANSNTIVITDSAANITRLTEIIHDLGR